MKKKSKEEKRIYKRGLMTVDERNKVNAERREEVMAQKMRSNKKLKRDINNNPTW